MEKLLKAAAGLPFWAVSHIDPEKRIAQGAIFTQSGQCHLADLSCDGRRHLFDLSVRAWTTGSALHPLYEELLHIHDRVNHTRAVTHVNEKLVEVAGEFSCRVHGTEETGRQQQPALECGLLQMKDRPRKDKQCHSPSSSRKSSMPPKIGGGGTMSPLRRKPGR